MDDLCVCFGNFANMTHAASFNRLNSFGLYILMNLAGASIRYRFFIN